MPDSSGQREPHHGSPILDSAAWERLERLLESFEEAWQRGERPVLDDYLVQAELGERPALLLELVHEDLDFRHKAGEPVRVESYLERYPQLRTSPKDVLGLIELEWKLRLRQEPQLRLEEFLERFPPFREQLLRVLALPETVRSWHPMGRPPDTVPPASAEPRDEGGPDFPAIPGYEIEGELGRGGMGVADGLDPALWASTRPLP